MKFVLMRLRLRQCPSTSIKNSSYLEIPQLRKPLCAAFQLATVRFDPFMHDPVSLHVPSLSKSPAAPIARIRTLASMTALMRL